MSENYLQQESKRIIKKLEQINKSTQQNVLDKYSFEGYFFYFFLPHKTPSTRSKLTQRISKFKGKITMNLHDQANVILFDDSFLKHPDKQMIKDYLLHTGKLSAEYNQYANNRKKILLDRIPKKGENGGRCVLDDNGKNSCLFQYMDDKKYSFVKHASLLEHLDFLESGRVEWHLARGLSLEFKNKTDAIVFTHKGKANSDHIQESHCLGLDENGKPLIHHLFLNAPRGTSIFQTTEEMKSTEKNRQVLEEKYEKKLNNIDHLKKASKIMLRPEPNRQHNYCTVCKKTYEEYFEHIDSLQHKQATQKNEKIYKEIEEVFAIERKRKAKSDNLMEQLVDLYFKLPNNAKVQNNGNLNLLSETGSTPSTQSLTLFQNFERQGLLASNQPGDEIMREEERKSEKSPIEEEREMSDSSLMTLGSNRINRVNSMEDSNCKRKNSQSNPHSVPKKKELNDRYSTQKKKQSSVCKTPRKKSTKTPKQTSSAKKKSLNDLKKENESISKYYIPVSPKADEHLGEEIRENFQRSKNSYSYRKQTYQKENDKPTILEVDFQIENHSRRAKLLQKTPSKRSYSAKNFEDVQSERKFEGEENKGKNGANIFKTPQPTNHHRYRNSKSTGVKSLEKKLPRKKSPLSFLSKKLHTASKKGQKIKEEFIYDRSAEYQEMADDNEYNADNWYSKRKINEDAVEQAQFLEEYERKGYIPPKAKKRKFREVSRFLLEEEPEEKKVKDQRSKEIPFGIRAEFYNRSNGKFFYRPPGGNVTEQKILLTPEKKLIKKSTHGNKYSEKNHKIHEYFPKEKPSAK